MLGSHVKVIIFTRVIISISKKLRIWYLFLQEEEKRKEELIKYGIFFEDDYDYMQHLRDTEEAYSLEPVERFRISEKSTEKQVSTGIDHGLRLCL